MPRNEGHKGSWCEWWENPHFLVPTKNKNNGTERDREYENGKRFNSFSVVQANGLERSAFVGEAGFHEGYERTSSSYLSIEFERGS
jgi:hypothetical protein